MLIRRRVHQTVVQVLILATVVVFNFLLYFIDDMCRAYQAFGRDHSLHIFLQFYLARIDNQQFVLLPTIISFFTAHSDSTFLGQINTTCQIFYLFLSLHVSKVYFDWPVQIAEKIDVDVENGVGKQLDTSVRKVP